MSFNLGNLLRQGVTDVQHAFNGATTPAPQQRQAVATLPSPGQPRPSIMHDIGNAISHIGAAPHPVQINSPQVIQKIQNAKYGVLAQGNNRNIATQQLNNAQRQAQPSVARGLGNVGNSFNNAVGNFGMNAVVKPFITQPIGDIAATIAQHPVTPWAPGGAAGRQALYGQQSFKPVLGGGQNGLYDSTRNHMQQSSNPLERLAAKPVAAADVAMHVANDIPLVGTALKAGEKAVTKLAPEAIPGVKAGAKALATEVKASNIKVNTNQALDAGVKQELKQQAAIKAKMSNVPLGPEGGKTTSELMGHLQQSQSRVSQMLDSKQKLSLKDRVLTPNIGLSMKDVSKKPAILSNADVPIRPRNAGSLAVKDTPISTADHLAQQIQAQEAARKAGAATGLDKVKAGVADIKAKMVDSLSPIEDRLNTKITADNATSHITPQLDRALRTDTIAGQYIKENGLAHVIQNVPNTKEFDQYLIAKHAADLGKQGIKTGRNAGADAQLVRDLSSKYEPHAQALKQYSNGLLDKAAEYGLIPKNLPSQLKAKYPNYVPANRIFGENELVKPPKGTSSGNASISQQSVVQKIKGSSRVIESPLSSIIDKTHAVIDQGERNKAAQILTGYKDLPGNPFNLRELKPSEVVGEKHVVSVLDNGKTRRFETDPAIAAAAKSLNKEQLGLVGKILNAPVRVLRMGATSLNPAFTGANIVKDLVTGAINSSHPLRSSVANPEVFVKALAASLNHGSKAYGELVREGAGGTSFDIARGEAVNNVKSIRAQKNAGTKIAYTVTHPAQLFRVAENAIGRSEEFSRALQYYGNKSAATASGASEQAAKVLGAHAARNNTTNFARSGDFGKVLNSVIPYLNAGFQGSRTLVRNLGDRPAQTTAKLVVGAFMPVAATTAWNLGTPDRRAAYNDIKPYEKQGNIIIVPPNPVKDPTTGKWNVIKIPLSQEVANLGNSVRNGIETGLHDGSFNKTALVGDLLGTATSLNLQSPRQAVGQVLPQAAKAPIEALTNQNLYTGNKIVPDSQKSLDGRDQYGPTSSGTARIIGNKLNISPRQIDNAIRTSAGGLGQNLINTSDNALAKLGVIQPTDVKGTSFGSAIQKRFNGAQGSNKYDAIDTKSAALTKQLKALPGYQNMSPADKAKTLNRATNAVVGTYTTTKALTPKQQSIDNGSVKAGDFLTTSTSGSKTPVSTKIDQHSQAVLNQYNGLNATQRKSKAYNEPSYDYKVAQAKYENDKANGKLSKAQLISQADSVAKAKIGSTYSKDTRDLYGLNKSEVYNLITTDPNGQAIANQLLAYGDALQKNGIENNKYRTLRTGAEAFAPKSTVGSSGSSSNAKIASAFSSRYSSGIKAQQSLRSLAAKASMGKAPRAPKASSGFKLKSYIIPKGTTTVRSRKAFA